MEKAGEKSQLWCDCIIFMKISHLFFIFAYIALIFSLMRPVYYSDTIYIPSTGRQLMLVLDVSGSMAQQDFVWNNHQTTRLDAVQNIADDFINARQGDSVGLTIFGTEAYLYTPLTPDIKTASEMLKEIGVGMAGDRTALGDALLLALKQMKDIPSDKKVIVLLSDGAANAGIVKPQDVIQIAKENGVKIHTVGLGADSQTIQSFFFTYNLNPSEDLDEALLKQMAQETGGKYFRVKTTSDLQQMYDMLNKIEPIQIDGQVIRPQKELFWIPLCLSMIFFFLGLFFKEVRQ